MTPVLNSNAAKEHLRVIGKISLLLAGLSTVALLIFSKLFETAPDADYAVTVSHLTLFKETLDHAMLIGALVLIALTAITTWLIALYSTFRVAGPLFRLARNLELLIAHRRPVLLGLRKGDRLRQEADELKDSQVVLANHYASLKVAVDQCRCDLERGADEALIRAHVEETRRLASYAML